MEQTERAAWLDERRKGIGGSDAAAILGFSPWGSQLEVWLSKRGELPEAEEAPRMAWGRKLEEVVAQAYEEQTGRKLIEPGLLVHPTYDCIIGTPDRLESDGEAGVEIKTVSPYALADWGEPGTDEIPQHYLIQCVHYMAITRRPVWHVAALVGGQDFRVYTVPRRLDVEAEVMTRLVGWWEEHIVRQVPPPLGASDAVREHLMRKFPRAVGLIRRSNTDDDLAAARYWLAERIVDRFSHEMAEAKHELIAKIGDDEGIAGDAWRATWRNVKGRKVVDWEAIAKFMLDRYSFELAAQDGRESLTAAEAAKELIEAHTKQLAAHRRFMFTENKRLVTEELEQKYLTERSIT